MHWSERIAKDIIKRSPDKEEYVCAAGISPSGSIHIGNFRDIATSYFVYKALKKEGKKARLLFSWDEFDRFRKVPVNVREIAPELEQDIGKPYVDVKDPYGCCASYAEHFEKEFERSLARFGIEVDLLIYLAGGSDPFPRVEVPDGARFVRTEGENSRE